MLNGTYSVTASDNPAFVVGESYPLDIDDQAVDVSSVTTTTISVTAIPAATTPPASEPALPPGPPAATP